MPISPHNSLFVIILLSSVILAIIAAGIVLALKFKRYRSRTYLFSSCIFLFQSLGIGGILLMTLLNDRTDAHFDNILKPEHLITGFMTIYFLLAYIVEIKLPGKLNLKSFLICISPFLIASVLLVLSRPIPLHTLDEVFNDIKRPDVWLRLVIVVFYFAYTIAAVCQKYEWQKCLVSRRMITNLHILVFISVPAFFAGMMLGFFPAIIINYITAVTFDFLVLYIELKIRIPVTERQWKSAIPKQVGESPFDNPELWMNPDMTVSEMAKIMGTNRTYLLEQIKGLGYSSYSDMINRKRVEYICKELEKGTDTNIIGLMFEAGFRSRSTASREFKRIVGCAPSEYQESVAQKQKS